jgi:hypothetical protein
MTKRDDVDLHRRRVAGRQRQVPNWYELDWDHVRRARSVWEPIEDVHLTLDAGSPLEKTAARLRRLVERRRMTSRERM